jgi:putative transposase
VAHLSLTAESLLDHLADADVDVLRTVCQHALQRLVELEATSVAGAAPYEHNPERMTYRNGHRPKTLDTRVGRLELQIPKLRSGSFCPSLLEPRRRIERALLAVVQEAYVHGVSTRKVDDLVSALGGCSISKSEVSRICVELDKDLTAFRERPLDDGSYPYIWFDATYQKVREGAASSARRWSTPSGCATPARRASSASPWAPVRPSSTPRPRRCSPTRSRRASPRSSPTTS